MGSPAYHNPAQQGPGHIVCLTWDSAMRKFGVDRLAGVWNDYGNPDRFRLWFDFADAGTYKRQRLADGLPVITSVFEKEGVQYEVQQWAFPLDGPPAVRRDDMPMTLFNTIRLTNPAGQPKAVTFTITHERRLAPGAKLRIEPQTAKNTSFCEDSVSHDVLFCVEGEALKLGPARVSVGQWDKIELPVKVELAANGSTQLIVKLPSPLVPASQRARLLALDAETARSQTLKFWSDYLARGAQFEVPEKVVNDLFRANLWHALRLPRRHGGQEPGVQIDLPYSNFAYDQAGTPWPVNEAAYVDYMLYDLRGYHDVSVEELLAIFHNNLEPNGHVKGCANWGTYTPGMLFAVGQNYRLSGDRKALEKLLPPTLKALDWCLAQLRQTAQQPGPAAGLYRAPLNDGTGEGLWGFNQAYLYAGLELFGQALHEIGHPRRRGMPGRGAELAERRRAGIWGRQRALAAGPVARPHLDPVCAQRSALLRAPFRPVVSDGRGHRQRALGAAEGPAGRESADRMSPPGPRGQPLPARLGNGQRAGLQPAGDGLSAPRRPEGCDSGVLQRHGLCLQPLAPGAGGAPLAERPVLRPAQHRRHVVRALPQHARARGRRRHPAAAGGHAAPLAGGRQADQRRAAPTYYGLLSMTIQSQAGSGRIKAEVDVPGRLPPKTLLIRFRHPEQKRITSASVDGAAWSDYDANKEWIRIPAPQCKRYRIEARY